MKFTQGLAAVVIGIAGAANAHNQHRQNHTPLPEGGREQSIASTLLAISKSDHCCFFPTMSTASLKLNALPRRWK